MAKRARTETIQTFTVSWFPIATTEACTIRCLSRASAAGIVADLQASFAAYPGHDPVIHVDRGESPVDPGY